mgnify:CR=1 FL=1
MKKLGLEYEDVYQIASITLYDCINKYDVSSNSSFVSYFYNCLENKLKNELRRAYSKKNTIIRESISLEKDDYNLLDIIPSNNNELDYIYESDYIEKLKGFKEKLDFNEICVIDLYLEGFKPREIELLLEEKYILIIRTINKLKDFDFTHSCFI